MGEVEGVKLPDLALLSEKGGTLGLYDNGGNCFRPPSQDLAAAFANGNRRAIELLYASAQLQYEQGLIK